MVQSERDDLQHGVLALPELPLQRQAQAYFDEVIDALNVIKAETPNRSPEQMAATLRAKYPQWVLEDLDWAELSRKMGDDDQAGRGGGAGLIIVP